MNAKKNFRINFIILICVVLVLSTLVGCGPSPEDLAAADYIPLPGGDWEVSSPEAEGLDPDLVAELYDDAALGHGGQVMALLDEFDMVILVIGDPFWLEDGWKYEKQLKNLVADFIASLPSE